MEELGWAGMPIVPTFKGFAERVRSETGHVVSGAGAEAGASYGTNFGRRASSSIHDHFKNAAKYIVGPLVGAFAIEKVGELVKDSVTAAGDLAAARNRARVIFGQGAKDADEFGERSAKALGLSHLAALQTETGFGLLGQRMGLTNKENVEFSQKFTQVGDDLAAFNHSDPGSAFLALQRGVGGATRGLKPYGVLIDSTSIKAEALAAGILKPVKNQAAIHAAQVRLLTDQLAYSAAVGAHGKQSLEAQKADAAREVAQNSLNTATAGAVPPLTQQQKMLAATKLILQQTKQEQGSFADSTHHLYGQQRLLSASFDDAKDRLGKGLLPVATDLVHTVNQDVVPAIDRWSKWFEHDGGPAIDHFEHQLKPLVGSVLPAMATAFHDSYEGARKLGPVVKGIFDAFNGAPDWVQKALVGGAVAGVAAHKLGILGGKGGLTGNLAATVTGGAVGAVPVRVVNWEQMALAGGGTGGPVGSALKKTGLAGYIPGVAVIAAAAAIGFAKGHSETKAMGGQSLPQFAVSQLRDQQRLAFQQNFAGTHPQIDDSPAAQAQLAFLKRLQGSAFSGLQFNHIPAGGPLTSSSLALKYGLSAQQARGLVSSPQIKATSTGLDAITAHAQQASRQLDVIGPHAAQSLATGQRAIGSFVQRLNTIHDKQVSVFVKDAAAFTSLKQLDAFHLQNKYLTVIQRNQIIDQAGGPGRPNAGSGGGAGGGAGGGSGGGASSGNGPVHLHLHVSKHELARVVLPMVSAHGSADQHWLNIQTERSE